MADLCVLRVQNRFQVDLRVRNRSSERLPLRPIQTQMVGETGLTSWDLSVTFPHQPHSTLKKEDFRSETRRSRELEPGNGINV